jgi:hypothetical protein
MSEHTPSEEGLNNPSVHSEPTDLSFRGVALFGVGLVAVLVVVATGSWGLLHLMVAREADQKKADYSWPPEKTPTGSATAAQDDQSQLPPIPNLEGRAQGTAEIKKQGQREESYKDQVKREEKYLEEYGWVEGKPGVVHIPIKEAMKKTAGRLKARDGKDEDEFLQAPSGSSSGRMPRGGSK